MCVILPVDHIPCNHTVPIWQHCIDAPRSKAHGLAPCQRIRQHARPILTRKLCMNCGGPRFFARRGAIAERGTRIPNAIWEKEEDHREANDSGYHSDAIIEEDEEDLDFSVSPRATIAVRRAGKQRASDEDVETHLSSRTRRIHRSPNRKPNWRPNLKSELTGEGSTFNRRASIDSQASSSYATDIAGRAKHSHSSSLGAIPRPISLTPGWGAGGRRPLLPALDTTHSINQKASTLLLSTSPTDEMKDRSYVDSRYSISNDSEDTASLPSRAGSTLLHPSPPMDTQMHLPMDLASTSVFPIASTTNLLYQQIPYRKGSTLLHPSTPTESESTTESNAFQFPLPTPPSSAHSSPHSHSHSLSANTSAFTLKVGPSQERTSVLHSSLSDAESEDESDMETDTASLHTSDREDDEPKTAVSFATTIRVARASRIEFHGANWRVLASPTQTRTQT